MLPILKQIQRYLLVFAFALPVVGFVALIHDNNIKTGTVKVLPLPSGKVLKTSTGISQEDKKEQEKEDNTNNKLITIDNFPVKTGELSSGYGIRKDPFTGKRRMHRGIDIAARSGTDVYPLGDGKVIFSGYKPGFGKLIEIRHGSTVITRYAHLKKTLVKVGQIVTKKDVIALVGNTGRSTGPHLHLEVAFNGKTVDPSIFLVGHLARR